MTGHDAEVEIYTIGFTKRTAQDFFESLQRVGVTRLIDVRLNNSSQLAAFAKRDDLAYFLKAICQADYTHEPLLAPTQELLDAFKKRRGSWDDYEPFFLGLMEERRIEDRLSPQLFEGVPVLLCSEHTAEHCHRRLVCEYLARHWPDVSAVHL
ncbi:MAG: hypothetical protein QOC92_901 [Acidimicrobiaceae bacterium]